MTAEDSSQSDVILTVPDGDFLRIVGVAEIKSRVRAGDQLISLDYVNSNGYLITYEKIRYGAMISSVYKVPFFLIVSLMTEGKLLMWRITDNFGNIICKIETVYSKTQATVNGGEAVRRNAILRTGGENFKIIE